MVGEWRHTTLDKIVAFLSGGTPSKSNPRYWGGSVPWVSAKDMKGFFLDDTEDHITEEGLSNGTRLVPEKTVLLLTRGMRLLNDVPISVLRSPMAFNQDIKALRPRCGLNEDFLPYLLLGHKHRLLGLVDLAGHGTGRLNTDELKSLDVLLPPEPEQRAIAHILGTLDDKIELNRKMNQTLEAIARAIFKSWFVDFDPVIDNALATGKPIPGEFAERAARRAQLAHGKSSLPENIRRLFPDEFQDSELGPIPKGWKTEPLDQIAHFLNGLALQKYPPGDGPTLPVIKIAQLRKRNTEGADQCNTTVPEDYVVTNGDVLFSWSGSLECVLWTGGKGALNQHLFKVTSQEYPKWFYYFWIHRYLPEFRRVAAGKATTMGHIQRHHLADARVTVPDTKVMETANRQLEPIIDQILELQIQAHTLADLRDSLLPKLLSGELLVREGSSA